MMKALLTVLHVICRVISGLFVVLILVGVIKFNFPNVEFLPHFFASSVVWLAISMLAAIAAVFWYLARLLNRLASRY